MHFLVLTTSPSMPLEPPLFNAALPTIYIYIYANYIYMENRDILVPSLQITHVQNDLMYWVFDE